MKGKFRKGIAIWGAFVLTAVALAGCEAGEKAANNQSAAGTSASEADF